MNIFHTSQSHLAKLLPAKLNSVVFRCLLLVAVLLLALTPASALATAYTASVSGNWNSSTTWGGAGVPGASDTAAINAGITVTVSDAEACTSIVMTRTTSSVLAINTGGTLTMSSTITQTGTGGTATVDMSAGSGTLISLGATAVIGSSVLLVPGSSGSTVKYTSSSSQAVTAQAYYNLTLANGPKTGSVFTNNGTLTISGSGVTLANTPSYGGSANLVYDASSGAPSKEWPSAMSVPVTLQNGASVSAGFTSSSTTSKNVTVNAGCTLTFTTKILTVNTPGIVDIFGTVDCADGGNSNLGGTGSCIVENGGILKSDSGGLSGLISIASTEVKNGGIVQVLGANGMIPTATWDSGSTLQLLGTGTPTMAASQSFQNVTVNNATGCTIGTACTINGTLTLTLGTLTVAATKPTLVNGANIVRTAGALLGAPTFGTSVNVTYNDVSATTTGTELPTSSTVLNNLTNNNTAGLTLNANTTINGTFATVYNGSTAPVAAGSHALTLNNNPVTITVSGSPIATDASYTIVSTSGGSVTGSTSGALTVTGSGAPSGATGESLSTGTGQLLLSIAGGTASQLQVVLPGQSGGAGAVTGTPTAQAIIVPFGVTVYAVDAAGFLVTSATPTVNFTSTDGSASLPANGTTTLVNGSATANVTFHTVGSQTVTATDAASSLTANTSSSVSVLGASILQTAPTPSTITYGQTLSASGFTGGSCTNVSGANVPGTFAYTTPTIAPLAGTTNVSVTFTPTSSSYSLLSFNLNVTVNQATPGLSNAPAASMIYLSQALSNSVLTGGVCTNAAGAIVPGKYAFTTPGTTPALGTASQSVTFTPTDSTNYSSISFNVSVTVTAFSTTTLTTNSAAPWTVPPGVTSVTVQMWGGGGAGGAALGNATTNGGGGGGGGGYSTATLTGLTPGSTIAFSVGVGGTDATNANGTSGGDTSFAGVTTAGGGSGGVLATTSTGGAGGTGGTGATFNGGAGAAGLSAAVGGGYGGGGGSGAGTNAVGVDASGLTGGISMAGGGSGGNGTNASGHTGNVGTAPGGGGAGGFEIGSSARAGGAGGNGQIIVTAASGSTTPPTLSVSQSGGVLTFSWTDGTFKLQSQTNSLTTGLGTVWFDYPGTSPVYVTINPANPSVFFRLSQ